MVPALLKRVWPAKAQQTGPATAGSKRGRAVARFLRDSSGGFLAGWNPALRSQRDDVRAAWSGVSARVVDAMQNGGWIAGAMQQMIADVNGPEGLTINVSPDLDALGWSEDEGHAWASRVEARFCAWANNPIECDARGKMTVADMSDAMVRWYMPFGEGIARTRLIERPGATSRTKIQLVAPMRLSQQSSELQELHQGVFLDGDGLPIGYRFRAKISGYEQDLDLRARDADGRPLVVHVFDGDPDQVRGISPLAPALKVARQYDQAADATATALLLQTIFAATWESAQLPAESIEALLDEGDPGAGSGGQADITAPGGMAALMAARSEWYSGAGIDLGIHGRIATPFPGDKLKFNSVQTPGGTYLPFSQNLQRELAACIGTTFESFTGDYAGATFSSLKMGIASRWPVVVRRRRVIPVPLLRAIFSAWLEEDIARGFTPFPGGYSRFLRLRAAASRTFWRGPAKPSPDEYKTAQAMRIYKDDGILSVTTISGELGYDAEAEQQLRARDRRRIMALGLPDPYPPKPQGGGPNGPKPDPEGGDDGSV